MKPWRPWPAVLIDEYPGIQRRRASRRTDQGVRKSYLDMGNWNTQLVRNRGNYVRWVGCYADVVITRDRDGYMLLLVVAHVGNPNDWWARRLVAYLNEDTGLPVKLEA